MTGDRQAPERTTRGRQWFRTFSWRDLRGWGGRYLWRYFWLLNVVAAISLVWLLLALVILGLTALGGEQWGATAAFGIGCGSSIPLAFGLLLIVLWANLAQADLAREDSGVGRALRRSSSLLGRRLGAITVLFLVALALGIVIGIGSSTLSIVSRFLIPEAGSGLWLEAIFQLALSAVEIILGSAVTVGFSACLVSLVLSDTKQEQSA